MSSKDGLTTSLAAYIADTVLYGIGVLERPPAVDMQFDCRWADELLIDHDELCDIVAGRIREGLSGADASSVRMRPADALAACILSALGAGASVSSNGATLVPFEDTARRVARKLGVARSSLAPQPNTLRNLRNW